MGSVGLSNNIKYLPTAYRTGYLDHGALLLVDWGEKDRITGAELLELTAVTRKSQPDNGQNRLGIVESI